MNREEFFAEAYEKGFRRAAVVLRRRGANPYLAEELAQAAWARGWERLRQLHEPERIVEWVTSIAVRMFWDHVTKCRRITPLLAAGLEPRVTSSVNLTAIDIDRFLDRPRQRELAYAVYTEGRSAEEIATSLGISVGAVHHRVSRLRAGIIRRWSAA